MGRNILSSNHREVRLQVDQGKGESGVWRGLYCGGASQALLQKHNFHGTSTSPLLSERSVTVIIGLVISLTMLHLGRREFRVITEHDQKAVNNPLNYLYIVKCF